MNFTLSTFEINKLPFLFFLKNKYLLCRMRYSKLELLNKKKYFTKKNNSLLTFLIFNKNLIDFKSYIDNFYEKIKNFSLETIEIFFFDFNSGTDFTYFFKSGYDNLKIIIFDKNYNSNIFFIYFNFLNEINGQYIFFADTKIEIIDIDLLNILKNFSNNDLEIIYFKINNKYFKFKFINYIPEFNIKEKKIELNINYNKNDLILPIYNFFLGRKNTINLWLKERLSAFIVNLNNFEIEQILLNNKYQKEIKKIFNIFFKSENEFFNKFDLVLFIKIQNKKIFYYENLQIFDSNYPNFKINIKLNRKNFYQYYLKYIYFFDLKNFFEFLFSFFIFIFNKISIRYFFKVIKLFRIENIFFSSENYKNLSLKKNELINILSQSKV